jgi:hypothetical protein
MDGIPTTCWSQIEQVHLNRVSKHKAISNQLHCTLDTLFDVYGQHRNFKSYGQDPVVHFPWINFVSSLAIYARGKRERKNRHHPFISSRSYRKERSRTLHTSSTVNTMSTR